MVQFEVGKVYKLFRQSGKIADRTMTVLAISKDRTKIKFQIGKQTTIEALKVDRDHEYISISLTSNIKYYWNPSAKDLIDKKEGVL